MKLFHEIMVHLIKIALGYPSYLPCQTHLKSTNLEALLSNQPTTESNIRVYIDLNVSAFMRNCMGTFHSTFSSNTCIKNENRNRNRNRNAQLKGWAWKHQKDLNGIQNLI
ncbi:hypothetical protein [Vibrio gallaecicus]|uniref:hypothetical protein n=1 Tax=Vibrio gallaecicus TaxID=552386 RepID=UPI0025B37491|nr:hypothetical protein [Vibrio gallaecicus]MDN3616083.1 hypothetical protein [Vibrio gallaecicus]